jgi:hypothetical protein
MIPNLQFSQNLNGASPLAVPRHIAEKMNQPQEVKVRKSCFLCGGYETKITVPNAIAKEQIEKSPDKFLFSDLKFQLKSGEMKFVCGECLKKMFEYVTDKLKENVE